jgi:hypothetical protein
LDGRESDFAPIAPTADILPGRRDTRFTGSRHRWRHSLPEASVSPSAPALQTKPRSKRSVTIDDLLTWAYRDQRVHRYLRQPIDWFLWALDEAGFVENRFDHRPVHHDAALVHEAVMALGQDLAHLVFHFAATGDRPERCYAEPRPVPLAPTSKFDDFGWYETKSGSRRQYLLSTAEIIIVEDEEWRLDGRKKMKRGRPRKNTRVEVQYAPIGWEPSPDYIRMTNDMAERWDAGLAQLERALGVAPFRAHVLRAG